LAVRARWGCRRGREHMGRRAGGGPARIAQHALRPEAFHAPRRSRLAPGARLAVRDRRDDRDGHRARRPTLGTLRVLGDGSRAFRLPEHGDAHRRPRHPRALESQGSRPRCRSACRVQRTVPLIPIALLAALVATQTFATGQHLVLDVRAAALAVAVVAVIFRAPFLVVIVLAAATAALLRLL